MAINLTANINKRNILIKESFCAYVCSRHYRLLMTCRTLKFFCRYIPQGPCTPGKEFSIFLLDFFFKFKTAIFCDFFTLNYFFCTLNSIYERDFLTVCMANISTWN